MPHSPCPQALQPRSSARFGRKISAEMAEEKSSLQSAREWATDHKFQDISTLINPFPLLLTRAFFTSVPFPFSETVCLGWVCTDRKRWQCGWLGVGDELAAVRHGMDRGTLWELQKTVPAIADIRCCLNVLNGMAFICHHLMTCSFFVAFPAHLTHNCCSVEPS
jgi:hypothetical protein